jgi:site-specific recombinase XerD
MAPDWKNPMLKVKAPKVVLDPLEPISIQDVRSLISTCQRGDLIGERDRAIFLFLLDTGARAREACNMNVKDVDLNTGAVMIRYGKGGKTRMVFIGRKTRRAMRAYLRMRHDQSPAVFVSKDEERLTYDGLRQLLERRTKRAKLSNPMCKFRQTGAWQSSNKGSLPENKSKQPKYGSRTFSSNEK